jgi:hypothetical protein
MTCVIWDDDSNLLRAYKDDVPIFTWTYSVFEKFLNESLTPSMYEWMANYVNDNITRGEVSSIHNNTYKPGVIEEEAVDAYFEVPITDRIAFHEKTLRYLKSELSMARAMMNESLPDDPRWEQFKRREMELHEEEQWFGGHESSSSYF